MASSHFPPPLAMAAYLLATPLLRTDNVARLNGNAAKLGEFRNDGLPAEATRLHMRPR